MVSIESTKIEIIKKTKDKMETKGGKEDTGKVKLDPDDDHYPPGEDDGAQSEQSWKPGEAAGPVAKILNLYGNLNHASEPEQRTFKTGASSQLGSNTAPATEKTKEADEPRVEQDLADEGQIHNEYWKNFGIYQRDIY